MDFPMILTNVEVKINDTIVVDNISYCWHNDLNRYTWCELEVSSYNVAAALVIFLFLLYVGISVISICGNSLVVWVIASTHSMKNATNYFIANLAVSDITISAFCTPFQFYAALVQRWDMPHFMCKFCPFAQTLSVNVSIFTLLVISHDRYRAIMDPFGRKISKTVAKIVIAVIWVTAFLLAIPNAILHKFDFVYDIDGNGVKPFCTPEELQHSILNYHVTNMTYNETIYGVESDEPVYLTQYQVYVSVLTAIQFGIPFLILSFSYTRMCIKLWRSKTPGNPDSKRDESILENKKRFIKMMAVVVGAFGICWFPWHFFHCAGMIAPSLMRHDYIHFFFFFAHWLAMSNSCYNPFIYAIFNEKFKRQFKQKKKQCYLLQRVCRDSNPITEEDIAVTPEGNIAGKSLPNGMRMHVIGPKKDSSTPPQSQTTTGTAIIKVEINMDEGSITSSTRDRRTSTKV